MRPRILSALLVVLVPTAPAPGQTGKDLGGAADKQKPRFVYEQTTGSFYLLQNGQKTPIATGYSGKGEGLNNPDKQAVANVGPIPQGVWVISEKTTDLGNKRPPVLALTPKEGKVPGDRSGFLIHGDNAKRDFSASEG